MENFEYTHNTTMNLGWFKDMKRFLKIKKQGHRKKSAANCLDQEQIDDPNMSSIPW